jgi:hypothetical protein
MLATRILGAGRYGEVGIAQQKGILIGGDEGAVTHRNLKRDKGILEPRKTGTLLC